MGVADDIALIDQHCHGVATTDVDPRDWLSEAKNPRRHPFWSMVGMSLRRWCAPELDLPPHAPVEDYLWRRAELGWQEVSRRLLRAAKVQRWFVDTGYAPGQSTTPPELAALGGGTGHEVLRIESVAESLSATADSPTKLLDAIRTTLHDTTAVALKSVVAYRTGLALPAAPPPQAEVVRAATTWLRAKETRLTDPVLLAWLVHEAAQVGRPLQFHTGFGDADLTLSEVDPALLTDFLRTTSATVVLLHCYPYHRNAAYLAHVFDNVYVDTGLMIPFVGARADAVLAEVLELAPFDSVLYSSDGNVLPELHHLGAVLWRQGLNTLADRWLATDTMTVPDIERLAQALGTGNATRLHTI